MREKLILVAITSIILVFYACNKDVTDVDKIKDSKLFMMYMGGDSDLEVPMWLDVNEIEFGLYILENANPNMSKKVKFVVLWDGIEDESKDAPTGARLYDLGADTELNRTLSHKTMDLTKEGKWWKGDEINTGDGDSLKNFMLWAKRRFPIYEHTTLIIADHGGGPRMKSDEHTKGAVWDYTSGINTAFLETKEITRAIKDAGFVRENKLSLLGFDACLMSSIEEAFNHRHVANYYIASLEKEQGTGWKYDHWIPQLTEEMTPKEIGKLIVKSYHDNFNYGGKQTLSCSDLNKIEVLKNAIDDLAKSIMNDKSNFNYKDTFEESEMFVGAWVDLYEIGGFAKNLISSPVSMEAKKVIETMKKVIVYSWADKNSGDYYGEGSLTAQGLSIMGGYEGKGNPLCKYNTELLEFANGDWADLYNKWYPLP